MTMRDEFTDQLKAAMKAGDAPRVSTLRMILARLKEVDIAARPRGVERVPDADILGMLRAMVKSRQESVALYRQGNGADLVAKEEAEIALIETFLPPAIEGEALATAGAAAIAETGATSVKDMGKVMGALKSRFGAALDMAAAGMAVRQTLGG